MSVAVRALAPSDREGWAELWQGYLAFYDTTLPEAQYDRQFARLTDADEPRFVGFVAEDRRGRLVGLAHCIWHGHGWTVRDIGYLQDLFTAPDSRGAGIGRALIETVYAHADARAGDGGATQVYWTTQDFNSTARKLYDQVGRLTPFVKYERVR